MEKRVLVLSRYVPLELRFWAQVRKTRKCWFWVGHQNGKCGYGRILANGRRELAHRLSWELHSGRKVPPGLLVLHTCDNPLCVRPDHLYVGTSTDNMRDTARRGRQWLQRDSSNRRGTKNPGAKLSIAQVRAIRAEPDTRGYTTRLAKKYGISSGYVSELRKGVTWKEV